MTLEVMEKLFKSRPPGLLGLEGLRVAVPAPSLGGSNLGTPKPCSAPCLSFPIYRVSVTTTLARGIVGTAEIFVG